MQRGTYKFIQVLTFTKGMTFRVWLPAAYVGRYCGACCMPEKAAFAVMNCPYHLEMDNAYTSCGLKNFYVQKKITHNRDIHYNP